MKQIDSPNQNWEPCTYGVIQETATVAVSPNRRLLKVAGFCLFLVCGSILGIQLSNHYSQVGLPEAFNCNQVKMHMVSYANEEIADHIVRDKITNHLLKCGSCSSAYDEVRIEMDPHCRHNRGVRPVIKPCGENKTP